MMSRPFLPFDATLWLALIAALAFTGYALYQLGAGGLALALVSLHLQHLDGEPLARGRVRGAVDARRFVPAL